MGVGSISGPSRWKVGRADPSGYAKCVVQGSSLDPKTRTGTSFRVALATGRGRMACSGAIRCTLEGIYSR